MSSTNPTQHNSSIRMTERANEGGDQDTAKPASRQVLCGTRPQFHSPLHTQKISFRPPSTGLLSIFASPSLHIGRGPPARSLPKPCQASAMVLTPIGRLSNLVKWSWKKLNGWRKKRKRKEEEGGRQKKNGEQPITNRADARAGSAPRDARRTFVPSSMYQARRGDGQARRGDMKEGGQVTAVWGWGRVKNLSRTTEDEVLEDKEMDGGGKTGKLSPAPTFLFHSERHM
ncbi:hypothetical protein FA13DRAFT_947107 [Coprinellus micaceus]|uniref:Uncharacterized protein n=1 Tax=Coprinellus micaceus TaxID=71717 RepID=A0A4Y7SZJ2_COPMI|nr:hypothetical protein FA13DRAFT_947107 [Coprinellus micaceus]